MARAAKKATTAGGATDEKANRADSTPLVDPHTYTDGVGFEPGNAAKSTKYRTTDGKVVDDLKGAQGWVVVQEGDRVTPEQARLISGDVDAPDVASTEQMNAEG